MKQKFNKRSMVRNHPRGDKREGQRKAKRHTTLKGPKRRRELVSHGMKLSHP
jgi:hypothetical protein